MAFPENQSGGGSSTFGDDGTASHEWASQCLTRNMHAVDFLGATQEINGRTYTMDEDRAAFVQVYLDDVRRRAIGGQLFVEYRVDLSDVLGPEQGGTADAVGYVPHLKTMFIEDLKYGTGEKIFASYPVSSGSDDRGINPQLGLYALGMMKDAMLFGEVEKVIVAICQPRLHHIDEFEISVEALQAFGEKAAWAVKHADKAMALAPADPALEAYLCAGEKQCRWCRAVTCPAREKRIAAEIRADFDSLVSTPDVPVGTSLARAYGVLPFIENWIKAVREEVARQVTAGEFIGEDGKPMKYVEGKPGKRQWADELAASAALVVELGEGAYQPRKIITAPAAAKILDKKDTKDKWQRLFEPLVKKAPGRPVLALGSDPRPQFISTANADEFDELEAGE
jgi:hypothetical protein